MASKKFVCFNVALILDRVFCILGQLLKILLVLFWTEFLFEPYYVIGSRVSYAILLSIAFSRRFTQLPIVVLF